MLIGIGVFGLIALFVLDRSAWLAPVSVTAPILYLQVVSVALVDLLNGRTLYRRTLAAVAVIVAMAVYQWLLLDTARDVVRASQPAALAKDPVR